MDSSERQLGAAPPRRTSGGALGRLLRGLERTRHSLAEKLKEPVQGPARVDADLLDRVEAILLLSEVGPELTAVVINSRRRSAPGTKVKTWTELLELQRRELNRILGPDAPRPMPTVTSRLEV